MKQPKVEFTEEELKVMALDYQNLTHVTKMMSRTVIGSDKLKVTLNLHDQIGEEIAEKLKPFLPKEMSTKGGD